MCRYEFSHLYFFSTTCAVHLWQQYENQTIDHTASCVSIVFLFYFFNSRPASNRNIFQKVYEGLMISKPITLKVSKVVRFQTVDDTFVRNVGNHLLQSRLGVCLSPCKTTPLLPKNGEKYTVLNFLSYNPTPNKILLERINRGRVDGLSMQHAL
jgi:hypothetical protein